MKSILLSFIFVGILISGCTSAINRSGNGNATGYGGGDPALTILDSLRNSLILAFNHYEDLGYGCAIPAGSMPGGSEGRPLWSLLHQLTLEQASYCNRFLKAVSSNAQKHLQQPVEDIFEISEATDLTDELGTPVRAKTSRSLSGKIIILRNAVDGLSRRTLATLITHELLHKMIPTADSISPILPTEFVHDSQAYGPFSDGRKLLDTLGVRLALHVAQQENLDCIDDMVKIPALDLCQSFTASPDPVNDPPSNLPRLHYVGGGSNGDLALSVPYLRDGTIGPQRIDGDFDDIELSVEVQMTWDLPVGVGDMDGDGRREMLFVNGGGVLLAAAVNEQGLAEKHRYVGPENTEFSNFNSEQTDIRPIGVGDLDGDGRDELVLIKENGDGFAISLNGNSFQGLPLGSFATDAGFELQQSSNSIKERPLAVGDIDGDGRAEILVVNNTGKLFVTRLSSSGLVPKEFLGQGVDFGMPGLNANRRWDIPIDMVDTNGDGYDDLVFTNNTGVLSIIRFVAGQVTYRSNGGDLSPFSLSSQSTESKELGGLWRWWW